MSMGDLISSKRIEAESMAPTTQDDPKDEQFRGGEAAETNR